MRVSTSPFRLGRAKECELYLKDDPMLSRVHCQLERVDGQWFAVDRESANGTRVNGLHVSGRSLLEEGDRVEIGRTLLLFTRHTPAVPEPAETIEELEPDDEEEDTRPVSTEEVQAAQRRVAATVLTANEAARMVGVVNKALSVIFRALDDVHGAGWRLVTDRGSTSGLPDDLVGWFASVGGAVVALGDGGYTCSGSLLSYTTSDPVTDDTISVTLHKQ